MQPSPKSNPLDGSGTAAATDPTQVMSPVMFRFAVSPKGAPGNVPI